MKILKIVLLIIVLLIVGFFFVGLFNPQVEYTASVTVNKPLEQTFELYNDINHLQSWIPEVKSVEVMEGELNEPGTRLRMTVSNEGNTVVLNERIIEFIPNQKVVLEFDAGAMYKLNAVLFTAVGATTVIEGTYSCRGSNLFYRSMFSFFKNTFKTIDQGYLDSFKSFSESYTPEEKVNL